MCVCLMRRLLRSLAHFLIGLFIFLLLSFKSSLYILGNSLLSDVSFVDIFSKSMVYFFHCLDNIFCRAGFLISMKPVLSVLYFMDCALVVVCKNSLPNWRSSRFSPVLSSKNFVLLLFTCSLIHFELIYIKRIKSLSRFMFLHVDVQLFQHYLLKRYFFSSIVLPLLLCQRLS